MSLRVRVALVMAVSMAVALLLQGVLGYLTFTRLVLADIDHDLTEFTREMVQSIEQSKDLSRLRATHERYIVHARLVDQQQVKFSLSDFPARLKLEQFSAGFQTVGDWRITQVPLRWQGRPLVLQTALTSPEFTDGLRNHRTTMLLSALTVVLITACVAYTLSGYALRPLQSLTRLSRRIATSNSLDETVPLPSRSAGEIYDLAVSFNQMLQRLEEFRSREAVFNRQVAHELRSPLTAMRLSLDAAKSGYADPAETLEVLDHELRRTQRLTKSILILARDGRLTQTESVDIVALAQRCARATGAQYKGLSTATLQGDEVLLQRALENLLENAATHAPGAVVTVMVQAQQRGLEVSVQDEGPGLPEHMLPHLTKEYYRAEKQDNQTGIGLGLSVVRHVMTAHQGRVCIENTKPHGLRVTLCFPEKVRDAGLML